MAWVKLDERFYDHPLVIMAGLAGWLHVCALCWVARHGEGIVPLAAVGRLTALPNPEELAQELVALGLWRVVEGGYEVIETDIANIDRGQPSWSRAACPDVYERDRNACRYCRSTERLSIDHVKPRVQGGSDDADNLVVACKSCNSRKGGRTPEQAGMTLLPVPGAN